MTLGQKIKYFRQQKEYSLQVLADLAGLSKPAIQQYEDDTITPSSKALQAIARGLGKEVWSFFESAGKELELYEFRHGEALVDAESEKKAIYNEVIKYARDYIDLEEIVGDRIIFENPISEDEINGYDDIEVVAKKLRKKWKLNNNPIDDVCRFLESKGFKIITIDRPTNSPGLCGFLKEGEEKIPFIIINKHKVHVKEITRIRFTILHELAHLLLSFGHRVTKEQQEKFCNAFASSFLLPAEVLFDYLGKDRTHILLDELKNIKLDFGISIQGIIYKAHSSRLITESKCDEWLAAYDSWRAAGNDFGEYTKSKETSDRFERLILRGLAEKKISREKAAELMNINIDQLDIFLDNKIFKLN
ncbi:MAG TPA: XRE family transcriptional regulator [Chitinophagaceae bacterium]|nr:XRE family transcriptional regulator [Chitinophagaceae bacterium]